jgi:hypothetical protein
MHLTRRLWRLSIRRMLGGQVIGGVGKTKALPGLIF